MATPSSSASTSSNYNKSVSSSPDPRLCPRVMIDIIPSQGRGLSTSQFDTVKAVHSYLRARSPNPVINLDLKVNSLAHTSLTTNLKDESPEDSNSDEGEVLLYQNIGKEIAHDFYLTNNFTWGESVTPHLETEQHDGSGYQASNKYKQLTAYVAWVNSQLKKKPGAHLVEDLRHDVRDGVALADLIEVIAGEALPDVHQAPSSHADMRENIDKVLQFMFSRRIKMHHITTRDIVEGNLKAIMRLILALAAHYKPNSVRHSSQSNRQNLAGIAQGAAAALTEARRNATRAGHRYRRRRQREDLAKHSDRKLTGEERSDSLGKQTDGDHRAELEGASANSSPVSSQNASPRTSLYLSDPPSSMEGLLSVSASMHRGGVMVTSCESDNAMGDSGYSEICDTLNETHEMLFHLHELLLTGDPTGDAKTSDLEGTSPKETIIILKGRLLHAEEVAESLRIDLTKVKKDCMELQGTRAGLQQRLKEQEGSISGLKSEVMKMELERENFLVEIEALKKQLAGSEQVLCDVKVSSVKQVEDKDRVIMELRRELLKRDHTINQLQEKMKDGLEDPKLATDGGFSFTTDGTKISATEDLHETSCQGQRLDQLTSCLGRLAGHDRAVGLKTSELETAKTTILQNRFQTSSLQEPSPRIDQLEETVVKLLDRIHINGSTPGSATSGRNLNSNTDRGVTTTPARRGGNVSQNWRSAGSRDVPKVAAKGRVLTSAGSGGSPGQAPPTRSSVSSQPAGARGQQNSPRGSAGAHAINRSSPTASKVVVRSQIPRPRGALKTVRSPIIISDAQTNVRYYIDQSDKPLTCVINKQLGEIKLRDFKSAIEDSQLYHYFFKVLDPEYGTVKEELSCDDDILPGREGKIVAWLEAENEPSS